MVCTISLIEVMILISYIILKCSSDPEAPLDAVETMVFNASAVDIGEMLGVAIDRKLNPTLHHLTQLWGSICNGPDNFIVSASKNNSGRSTPPWTVAVEVLRYADSMKASNFQISSMCGHLDTFSKSVENGSRLCSFRLLSPNAMCRILNRYSIVYWVGDSLTRHTLMAMLSVIVLDLRTGAVPKNSKYEFHYEQCQCDGIYSESMYCRQYDQRTDFTRAISKKCKELIPEFSTIFEYVLRTKGITKPQFPQLANCSVTGYTQEDRPMLLYYQGCRDGPDHNKIESEDLTQIQPIINWMKIRLTKCRISNSSDSAKSDMASRRSYDSKVLLRQMNTSSWLGEKFSRKIGVILTGGNVQHKRLDRYYPFQARNVSRLINEVWKEYIRQSYPGMQFLDFWNITMQPPAETSDGFHYLTATNIEKANSVVHLMNLLLESPEDDVYELHIS